MYLGVDIGGTAVKLGLVSATGQLHQTKEASVSFDQYKTPMMTTVLKTIDSFLGELNMQSHELKGIGVSATGQIDTTKGEVIGGGIIHWRYTPIKHILETRYQVPVSVCNDANCMVLGERWQGRAKGCQHVVGITLGTGVGGGVIVNDQLLGGCRGLAGELGHFSLNKEGKRCACGNYGCYEQYASMTALVRRIEAVTGQSGLNGRLIFSMTDEAVKNEISAWVEEVGCGIVSLIHLFNPTLILIGGGVSAQEKRLLEPLREYVFSHAMPCFTEHLKIEAATLGNHAGIIGAVYFHQKSMS